MSVNPFTRVTITHQFENLEYFEQAYGTVTFTLNKPMHNGGYTINSDTFSSHLNLGYLSAQVYATNDEGTVPSDVVYEVRVELTGGPNATILPPGVPNLVEKYYVQVPASDTEVDLLDLVTASSLSAL